MAHSTRCTDRQGSFVGVPLSLAAFTTSLVSLSSPSYAQVPYVEAWVRTYDAGQYVVVESGLVSGSCVEVENPGRPEYPGEGWASASFGTLRTSASSSLPGWPPTVTSGNPDPTAVAVDVLTFAQGGTIRLRQELVQQVTLSMPHVFLVTAGVTDYFISSNGGYTSGWTTSYDPLYGVGADNRPTGVLPTGTLEDGTFADWINGSLFDLFEVSSVPVDLTLSPGQSLTLASRAVSHMGMHQRLTDSSVEAHVELRVFVEVLSGPGFISASGAHYDGTDSFCDPSGACCANGGCSILSEADCVAVGGVYQGNGIPCESVNDCQPTNTAPTCVVDTSGMIANPDGSFTVTEGETFIATFIGSDTDATDSLTIGGTKPASALLTPDIGESIATSNSSVPVVLAWTPAAWDAAGNPHEITVTFTDSLGETTDCTLTIIVNRNPVAACNGPISAEAATSLGALIELDGSLSLDPDADDTLLYHWEVSDLSVVLSDAESASTSAIFPIGVTMATLTVVDGRGGVSTCDLLVTVEDSMPPEVMVTTDIASIWPPNHSLRPVRIIVTTTDTDFNPEAIVPLVVTVRSSEVDDAAGNGDGATTGDVHGQNGHSAPVNVTALFTFNPALGDEGGWEATVNLRVERAGNGTGRAYTIDVTAFDSSLNVANTSCVVVVPHDRRNS